MDTVNTDYNNHRVTWLIKLLGEGKSTVGVRNFNLRSSQVREEGGDWLEPIHNIHKPYSFPSTVTPIFLFSPLQIICQKLSLGIKIFGGEGICPLPPSYVYDDVNDDDDNNNNEKHVFKLTALTWLPVKICWSFPVSRIF